MTWYAQYFGAVTGRKVVPEDLITISEAVYNFQRIFNLKMGFGTRAQDILPYRAVGPVTEEEYESRQERYDGQLIEKHGVDGKIPQTQIFFNGLSFCSKSRKIYLFPLPDNPYRFIIGTGEINKGSAPKLTLQVPGSF